MVNTYLLSLLSVLALSAAPAFADVPTTKLVSAPPVSTTGAFVDYGAATTHTSGPGAWTGNAPEIVALARTLGAHRLPAQDYARNVRDYVRNNIAVEFRFGLSKGARGALLDQSGTPFDQAELMVKLLREGGVAASYQLGTVQLSAQQFGQWTGQVRDLSSDTTNPYTTQQAFTVDKKAACKLLADGGIPADFGVASCDDLTGTLDNGSNKVTLAHVWVRANGQDYDPSLKFHILRMRKSVPQMMGCGSWGASTCAQSAVTAMASVGTGSFGGVTSYNNVLEAGIAANVSGAVANFAANLQHGIEAIDPAMPVTDLVGGKILYAPRGDVTVAATYNPSGPAWTGDVPDQYRTALQIIAPTRGTFKMFGDDIAGRRLSFMGIGGDANVFVIDNVPTDATCNDASCQAPSGQFQIKIDHPYRANGGAYGDETLTFEMVESPTVETGLFSGTSDFQYERSIIGSFPVTIIHGFGQTGGGSQQAVNELQSAAPETTPVGSSCKPSTSYSMVIPASCVTGAASTQVETIRTYESLFDTIVTGVTGAAVARHHDIGIVYSSRRQGGAYMSLQSTMSMAPSRADDVAARDRAFDIEAYTQPKLELLSTYNWAGGGYLGGPVLSGQVLDIAPSQMAAVLAALPPIDTTYPEPAIYETRRRAKLQAAADAGYSTIITTSVADPFSGELFYRAGERGFTFWQSVKGGGVSDPAKDALKTTQVKAVTEVNKKYASVSLADGALNLAVSPDIVSGGGDFPRSLPFQRTYVGGPSERLNTSNFAYMSGPTQVVQQSNSWIYTGGDSDMPARIGGGWVHNYDITASLTMDAARSLGSLAAIEAANTVAKVVAMNEVAGGTTTADRLKLMLLPSGMSPIGWSIRRGASTETFVALADGRMNPPPRSQAKLVLSDNSYPSLYWANGTMTYTGADGDEIYFDKPVQFRTVNCLADRNYVYPTFRASKWTFPDGVRIDFDYELRDYWTSIPTLVDGCVGAHAWVLTGVHNNLGRSLTFTSTAYNGGVTTTNNPGSPDNGQGGGQYGVGALTVGYKITQVTDDQSGRYVKFESPCSTLLCDSLTVKNSQRVVDAAGNASVVEKLTAIYAYAPNDASPDPSFIARPKYRLRRIFTATDTTKPIETVVYDELYRVKAVTDKLIHTSQYFAGGLSTERWRRAQQISPRVDKPEITTTIFDDKNSAIYIADPLGRETLNVYDNAGRVLRTVYPRQNALEKQYDLRGNVTRTCAIPTEHHDKACDVDSDLVTKTTYVEGSSVVVCANLKVCNKPDIETDAMGKQTAYKWNGDTGQLTRVVSPADKHGKNPQVDLDYTPAAGIKFGGADGGQISLLTSKTEKISDDGSSVVSVATVYEYDPDHRYTLKSVTVDPGGKNIRTCFGFDDAGNLVRITDPRADTCPAS